MYAFIISLVSPPSFPYSKEECTLCMLHKCSRLKRWFYSNATCDTLTLLKAHRAQCEHKIEKEI